MILTCKDGKQYGVISNVGQSATVTAQQSEGARYCQPEKKKDGKDAEAAPPAPVLPSEQHDLDLGPP